MLVSCKRAAEMMRERGRRSPARCRRCAPRAGRRRSPRDRNKDRASPSRARADRRRCPSPCRRSRRGNPRAADRSGAIGSARSAVAGVTLPSNRRSMSLAPAVERGAARLARRRRRRRCRRPRGRRRRSHTSPRAARAAGCAWRDRRSCRPPEARGRFAPLSRRRVVRRDRHQRPRVPAGKRRRSRAARTAAGAARRPPRRARSAANPALP